MFERHRFEGDSLAAGHVSELWDYTRISVTQNNLQELKVIWDQWNDETKRLFYHNYGDLPYLLGIKVDEQLFRALTQYWNPAYCCFTFGRVDLVPTKEEYTALLHYLKVQVDRIYSRAAYVPTFWKKLMSMTGMGEQWITARKQKGECKCIPWRNLRDLILAHPDMNKRVDVFALSIYGLMLFLRALGYVDEAVTDFFDQLSKGVTLVPAILVEIFRSLNACRRSREDRLLRCAQLLLVDKVSYRVFSDNYSPLKEITAIPRRDDVLEENWMALLQNRQEENIEWRAPWFVPNEILFRCGSFDWFILATHGLAQCEFSYKGDNYKKRIKEICTAWNQTRRMKKLTVRSMTTPEYSGWFSRKINDNIPRPSLEGVRSMEEYLQVVPSELEIIKNQELDKRIEQLEEKKTHLRLDADVQKLEAERQKKGKNKTTKTWIV
ncbi:Nucleoside-triphosphatase THEP1 [Gossypium australe]|uniref:Nucleoside-triphosphatase THEP1 n=1 Tax=Gossypium australe TaxID=47621 RepID=A0A5B6VKI6_9ROSI|nr:Nucleoside-triphosphatase THEP1 [Gossypium australe]